MNERDTTITIYDDHLVIEHHCGADALAEQLREELDRCDPESVVIAVGRDEPPAETAADHAQMISDLRAELNTTRATLESALLRVTPWTDSAEVEPVEVRVSLADAARRDAVLLPMTRHRPAVATPPAAEPVESAPPLPPNPGDVLRLVAEQNPGLGWLPAETIMDFTRELGWPHDGIKEPASGLRGALKRAVADGSWSRKSGRGREVLFRPGGGRTR